MIDNKVLNELVESLRDVTINMIGAIFKFLEVLVETNNIKGYIEKKFNCIDFSKYFKSYEFCICFCLEELTRVLRDNHTFLGFQEDRLFISAYDNIIRRSIFPNESKLCKIANNIFGLMDMVFKAKIHKDLMKSVQNVKDYIVIPLKEYIYTNFEVKSKLKNLTKDEAFLKLARSYFHLVFLDGKKVRIAFQRIVQKGEPQRRLLGDDFLENMMKNSKKIKIESEEDLDELFNPANLDYTIGLPEKLSDHLFFDGYKFIMDYLWDELFNQTFLKFDFLNEVILSRNWREFDGFYDKIRDEIIFPLERNNEAFDPINKKNLFIKNNEIQKDFLNLLSEKILFSVKRESPSDEEKIDESFLWYKAKVINSKVSIPCANEFILILMGLYNSKEKEKDFIRIVRFIHPFGDAHNYSYAILVEGPQYSYIADYAVWYVFLDFATDHSGTGNRARQIVELYIDLLKSQVHVSECTVNRIVFKKHLRDREIKKLKEEVRKLEDIKADAKGFNFELVGAYIFSRLGYQTYWRFKNKCSDYKEIDLIAYKELRTRIVFYIVEITSTEGDLLEEVKEKIDILRKNSSQLLEFLKLEHRKTIKFKGMVISDAKTDLQVDRLVKIINYKNMKIETRNLFKIVNI